MKRPSTQRKALSTRYWTWLTLAVLLGLCLPAHSQRVALLLGNANYSVGRLTNPPNDVAAMESALNKLGFKVQKVLDANQTQMKRAVRDFGSVAQNAEVAFVYYSGHGTQALGENYLIPIDATIEKESDYDVEAVAANSLLRQLQIARPKAAILVLDACRDNPLAAQTRSGTKGLARMDAPTGTMIAFATAPNTTASDNGDYAKILAHEIQKPGLELLDVFRNTTAEVKLRSGGKQEPRISEVSITDRLYLAGHGHQTTSVTSVPPSVPNQTPSDPEQAMWDIASRRDAVPDYQAYLSTYPNGRYASVARAALAGLQQQTHPPQQAEHTPATQTTRWTAIDAGGKPTTPNGHACVRDNLTGLLWSVETVKEMNWTAAMDAGRLYSRCNYSTGWRLPTETELQSIVRKNSSPPTIDTTFFPNTSHRPYWAQDLVRQNTAWTINFRTGFSRDAEINNANMVRFVRTN